jgi:hypothetical protein
MRELVAVDALRQVVLQRLEQAGIDDFVGVANGATRQSLDVKDLLRGRGAAERVERSQAADGGMMKRQQLRDEEIGEKQAAVAVGVLALTIPQLVDKAFELTDLSLAV